MGTTVYKLGRKYQPMSDVSLVSQICAAMSLNRSTLKKSRHIGIGLLQFNPSTSNTLIHLYFAETAVTTSRIYAYVYYCCWENKWSFFLSFFFLISHERRWSVSTVGAVAATNKQIRGWTVSLYSLFIKHVQMFTDDMNFYAPPQLYTAKEKKKKKQYCRHGCG